MMNTVKIKVFSLRFKNIKSNSKINKKQFIFHGLFFIFLFQNDILET